MSKPQIVLVPGAWHSPDAFSTVTSQLESNGYTVHTRQLPSVGNDNPPKDLTEDVNALQELVTKAIGTGNEVIVAPHSWAGIITGSALTGFGKKQREEKGEKGGVVTCAYMCAFIVPEGVSLHDAAGGVIPPWYAHEDPYTVVKDGSVFYNDLPEEQSKHWQSQLQTHSYATQAAPATGASWKEIPTRYLLCEDDQAIPAFAQELMANGVKEAGGDIEVERIKTSHSPFLSRPDLVVNWIRRVAGETI
ncbi:alpha/beta-hydrolase [Aaosphaeria arxii CBS 175.79]|uniref:Alpha/beta-hydrolase n=1 Tax=Aaosphaeria arxii CBS 175.79 TaxID=1450172 RepID=A0A6A5XUD0_9PLEO|nr:alpha/beta-hydrolase [Aaosphaeria arxii CBS 175.79]KAF2016526.1 alpha/beta-hydrolase [Aaosphaeria arxii CBS 175.79]